MVNILDRSDRSLPDFRGAKTRIPQRTKNNWSQGGKQGRFCMVDKNDLNIDGRYQRSQVSEAKVLEIARNWDWALLGVVLVVERNDGTYWVFDGGHRTRATFYRDDIQALPCMVYSMDELSEEAKAFLGKNLMITNVSSVDKYKAAVVAKDDTACKASKLLADVGIEVTASSKSAKKLTCIGTLLTMIDKDEALAKRCLLFCVGQAEAVNVSCIVMRGVFALCHHFADRVDVLDKFGEKLARHSQAEMLVRIRQMRAECGKGGEKVEALALLSLINKGCQHKLPW